MVEKNKSGAPGGPVLKRNLVPLLLASIFRGEWKTGDRLPEVELAERFGVSRTPVREALGELAGVGLIELRPNCGAVMRPFGPRQIREIYQVREILETEATRLATGRLEPNKLDLLARHFDELLRKSRRDAEWSRKEWQADRLLHALIAKGCGNQRLAEEVGRHGNLIQAMRETVGNQRQAQVVAIQEHLAILGAVLANDANAAAEAMRRHVRSSAEIVLKSLAGRWPQPEEEPPSGLGEFPAAL